MSETKPRSSVLVILIGLVITLGAAEVPVTRVLAPQTTMAGHVEREAYFWAVTLAVILYILVVERRPVSSIGLRFPTWQSFAFGIPAGIVLVAGIVLIQLVVFPLLHLSVNQHAMSSIRQTPLWFRLLLVARAAVFEEICYRGYAIERVTELTGWRWLAALVSIATFTYAHVGYWGWSQLLVPGFGGVVLAGLYLWRRDLSSNMIAHFFADGMGFLFG